MAKKSPVKKKSARKTAVKKMPTKAGVKKKAPVKQAAAKKSPVKRKPAKPVTVSAAVATLVKDLGLESAEGETLGAIALNLAGLLDEGAGMASAAVARELRETIDRMCDLGGGDSEDAFAQWEAQLNEPG